MISKPEQSEYPTFYKKYIDRITDEDVIHFLRRQKNEFSDLILSIPEDKMLYRYADGKWTIKQVLGHIIDTERIMAYRALVFSRGERQPVPGFSEENYVNSAAFNHQKTKGLISEFKKLRESNIAMIGNFNDEMLVRKGNANNLVISVRSLVYILAGHLDHHRNIIVERYLS